MCKLRRQTSVATVMLGTVFLSACVHAPGRPGAAQAYSIHTPLDVIAADPDGMGILVRDVPGVMFSPKYPLIEDMSLSDVAMLSGGRLPKSKLDEVQADLNKLAAQRAAAAKAAAPQAAAKPAAGQGTAPPAAP